MRNGTAQLTASTMLLKNKLLIKTLQLNQRSKKLEKIFYTAQVGCAYVCAYLLCQYDKTIFMRFNFRTKGKTATVNHEGAKAYTLTPEMELYSAIATTMLNDSFYEKADDRLARIKVLMAQVNAPFIAKLAVYARQQMNLRTAPVVLATELAKTS